jgi:hypothetical protein
MVELYHHSFILLHRDNFTFTFIFLGDLSAFNCDGVAGRMARVVLSSQYLICRKIA